APSMIAGFLTSPSTCGPIKAPVIRKLTIGVIPSREQIYATIALATSNAATSAKKGGAAPAARRNGTQSIGANRSRTSVEGARDGFFCSLLRVEGTEVPHMTTRPKSSLISPASILLLFCAGSLAAAPPATRPAAFDEQAIAELVAATSFKDFGRSTEGTVLARFERPEHKKLLRVWVAEKGTLRA